MKTLLRLGALVCLLLLCVQLAFAQAPTFSPSGGSFTSPQSVTITCGSGQTAAYTLDGSTPNLASKKYTSAVTVSSTATLKAICANIQSDSQETQTSMGDIPGTGVGWKCVTPVAHTYGSLSCQAGGGIGSILPSNIALTFGATMNYLISTTASSSETQSLTVYEGPGCDSCNYMAQDFWVEAVGDSSIIANNEMDMVTFNHTHGVNHQIGLQCNQQSGKLQWQIDSGCGTGWINTGIKQACPIPTTAYTHVGLAAHWVNGDTSGPQGRGYTYYDRLSVNGTDYDLTPMGGQPNCPTTNRAIVGNQMQIDLTNTTRSGHNPTTGSRNLQHNNIAASIGPPSAVASANFTISGTGSFAATPNITPGGGFYPTTQTVTITDSTGGAVIHYTTDGSTPTGSSTTYTTPLTVSSTTTVKAIAIATGFVNSAVASAVYTIGSSGGLTATPVLSPTGGSYTSSQFVTISDTTSGAVIYYTTDGTLPTTASNVYSIPLAVAATATIKAMAVAPGLTNSSVVSATYTITSTPVAATPTFSPLAGIFTGTQTVTISDSTPSPTIHYTTDGSTPTGSSTTYTTSLTISSTTTVKAIAVASGFTNSNVGSATYTIGCGQTPFATGNVDYSQVKAGSRQGAGPMFQMAAGGYTTNFAAVYDCNGNLIRAAGAPITSITTTGSSGPATLSGGVLNIPQYTGGSSGFPITLGSTSIASGSTTTAVTGLTVDGVSPTTMAFVDPTSSIQTQLNGKQATITLTTTGSSGAATLTGSTLNIPNYTGGGGSPGGATGQVQYNNAGAFGGFTLSGDGTLNTSTGALSVTKTGGVAFAPSATTDTTNASNITSGTIPAAQLPLASSSAFGAAKCDGTTITCASGVISSVGGSMVYPSGSGIPIVVSGTSWGTTVAAPTGAVVGTTDTQTLTNKTVNGCTIVTAGTNNRGVCSGLPATLTGHDITALGFGAAAAWTTGTTSTAIGQSALALATTSVRQTAVGSGAIAGAGGISLGSSNTAMGAGAMFAATTISADNIAIGDTALGTTTTIGADNVAVGDLSQAHDTGSFNTSVGHVSLTTATSGQQNTAVGYESMQVQTTGQFDTCIGSECMLQNTTGANNVAVGHLAGSGTGLTTLASSVFLGDSATSTTNALTDMIVIGASAQGTASHQATVGASTITSTILRGLVQEPGMMSSGTKFTTSGCSVSSTTGGGTAGIFTLGANTCTVVVTLNGATGLTATNGWSCQAHDRTAPTVLIGGESSSTTTTASIAIPAGAGATDVIGFSCVAF